MTYEESVDWLFSQFPAYQKIGISAYKPDLDNVLLLCEYFEVDSSKLKFIHIAGTNGKGSTSNYLASILQESGLKTGLFTSPHILDFRERIRINGKVISEQKVIDFCEKVQNSEFDVKPSFFEITWLLALIHFLDESCKICVIETGLGGRLDATNIITPILSIITTIGLDHTSILGNSLEEIAFEKAGIIKKNVPVLIGEKSSVTQSVFENKAKEMSSKIYFSEDFYFDELFFEENNYQAKNEKTVRAAIHLLNKYNVFSLTAENSFNGFKFVYENTGFYGRFQQISEKPRIIIDAAHNKQGIKMLLKSISNINYERLFIVYGASNDKNIEEILSLFPEDSCLNLCAFSNMRSFSTNELTSFQLQNKNISKIFPSIDKACFDIQTSLNEKDMLLITGSFFLLSDFFDFFSQKNLSS